MKIWFVALLLALSCSSPPTLAADGLVGRPPAVAKAAPTFGVMNQDQVLRDGSALRGHPTVLWFYPMAGTPG